MKEFCKIKKLTLTLGKKSFAELFSCKEPKHNPILIVAVANTHSKEKITRGIPNYKQFRVLLLLFQEALHVLLLFSYTHMNLHLGNMIRNMDYGASFSFYECMKKDVNYKLVPIQHERTGSNVQQQLYLSVYYTTSKSTLTMN